MDRRGDGLIDRWIAVAGDGAREIGVDLLDRYSEPHRRYHDRNHLADVLDGVDDLAIHADNAQAVRLAAWFHDAVYDVRRGDNEEESARLAERCLGAEGATVARLVRLTATHDPAPGDRDGAVLCDADLAVLARDPAGYAAYAQAVRQEYAFVPERDFKVGRAAVLRSLLDRPQIFRTPEGLRRFEDAARRNAGSELRGLAT